MSFLKTYYRWNSWNNCFENFEQYFYDFKYGVKNLFNWFSIVWADRDWDNLFLYQLLQFKFSKMADNNEQYSLHVGKDIKVRKMRVCAEIFRRQLSEDFYEINSLKAHGQSNRSQIKAIERHQEEDMAIAFNLMRRHIKSWWN